MKVVASVALIAWAGMLSNAIAASVTVFPKVESADLQEVGSYEWSQSSQKQQSGERVVVDAVVVDEDAANKRPAAPWFFKPFKLTVPQEMVDHRLCIEFASSDSGFRKVTLLDTLSSATNITAKIDPSNRASVFQSGGLLVAFPASGSSSDPQAACRQPNDDWLFPISLSATDTPQPARRLLQLLVNAGSGEAYIELLNSADIPLGDEICSAETHPTGLHNRLCSIELPPELGNTFNVRLMLTEVDEDKRDLRLKVSLSKFTSGGQK